MSKLKLCQFTDLSWVWHLLFSTATCGQLHVWIIFSLSLFSEKFIGQVVLKAQMWSSWAGIQPPNTPELKVAGTICYNVTGRRQQHKQIDDKRIHLHNTTCTSIADQLLISFSYTAKAMHDTVKSTNLSVLCRGSFLNDTVPRNWHVGLCCFLSQTMTFSPSKHTLQLLGYGNPLIAALRPRMPRALLQNKDVASFCSVNTSCLRLGWERDCLDVCSLSLPFPGVSRAA